MFVLNKPFRVVSDLRTCGSECECVFVFGTHDNGSRTLDSSSQTYQTWMPFMFHFKDEHEAFLRHDKTECSRSPDSVTLQFPLTVKLPHVIIYKTLAIICRYFSCRTKRVLDKVDSGLSGLVTWSTVLVWATSTVVLSEEGYSDSNPWSVITRDCQRTNCW